MELRPSSAMESMRHSTEHLLLRPYRAADVSLLYEIQADRGAMRFTYSAPSPDDCARRLQKYEDSRSQLGYAPWVVLNRGDSRVIGWGGLNVDPFDCDWGVEVSYFFHPEFWGRGLATELVRYSLHHAFQDCSLSRVDAFAMRENTGSIRVLEKCGFALLRYEPRLERNHYRIENLGQAIRADEAIESLCDKARD
jgi:[ribosomal protein S5]-alanine N-acetyltransferase